MLSAGGEEVEEEDVSGAGGWSRGLEAGKADSVSVNRIAFSHLRLGAR